MKNVTVLLVTLVFTTIIYSKPKFLVTEQTTNSVTLYLELDSIKEKKISANGEDYTLFNVEGFGYNSKEGEPVIPSRILSLITSEKPDIKIEILESEIELRNNQKLYPLQKSFFDYMGYDDLSKAEFIKNRYVYSKNEYYPKNPLSYNKTVIMRGVPLSFISISPFQINCAKKELRIYKKLKVKISFSSNIGSRMNNLNSASASFLNNKTLNLPQGIRREINSFEDYGEDVLMITSTRLLSAAKKLATWERMKGYDVKIESKDLWDVATITDVCHSFYKNTLPKPGYIVFFGDHEDVPTQIKTGTGLGEEKVVHTDHYFACTDGPDDKYPEMASGRISVDNPEEAMLVVDKLIKYEKNPPTKSSFYNNHFGCAYYQDHGNTNGENVADRAFVYYVEEVRKYLDENYDKNGQRLYWTKASTAVKYWNDDPFAFGGEVPIDLQRPQYSWSLTADEVANAFNDGVFLAYYSDHGNSIGWGYSPSKFAFYQEHLNSLVNNGELLPIVLNIACATGSFQNGDGFAEDLLSLPNGGAVGNVAASIYSWSGYNEALFLGIIDAIWPSEKMDMSTPHMPDPEITTRHDPIYTMGDVLLQGKFRMTETWNWQEDGDVAHYEMYHYFGDPTTAIWTEEPKDITTTETIDDVIANSGIYNLSGLGIDTGFATLYNKNSDEIIGKASVSGGAANIKLQNSIGSDNDDVVLTVRSHNYRPLIKEIKLFGETSINDIPNNCNISLKLYNNEIRINKPISAEGFLTIFDLKGKEIKKENLKSGKSKIHYSLSKSNISKGFYVISAIFGEKTYKLPIFYK